MISFNLLCNTATAYKTTGLDEDRNPTYDDGTELTRVYINYNHAQSDGTNGKQPASAATLYYDVQNSKPANYSFVKGQKVVIDNENYFVTSIHPYYNADGLQHYEVNLD